MDPDQTLAEIRVLADKVLNQGCHPDNSISMALQIQALDTWISSGGFLPEPWSGPRAW
jgi:hypothetical protein